MTDQEDKKILIIDDEEGIRESLKLILSDFYQLILTDDADQGLDIIQKQENIGLVLLDIKMPKANGLDVLKQIKNMQSDLPVIMVTGYKSVETASEASSLGADGYIIKPFKSDEILEKVEKLI